MFLMKLLFPKLAFGIDDLNGGGGAPSGQPDPSGTGNDDNPNPEPAAAAPTEFIEVKGVKIPASEFETLAREKYKDRFEAFDNREKWQAENTRKAQEIAEIKRKAELADRLMADPRLQQPNQNVDPQYEAQKAQYIARKQEEFPDVNPKFFKSQFDDLWELRQAARESVDPILESQGRAFEEKFLAEHPKVERGSREYEEIAELIGSGVKPERAYQIVFHDDILKEKTEAAIKQRDEEAKRKLRQNPTSSTPGSMPKSKNFRERAAAIIDSMVQ